MTEAAAEVSLTALHQRLYSDCQHQVVLKRKLTKCLSLINRIESV